MGCTVGQGGQCMQRRGTEVAQLKDQRSRLGPRIDSRLHALVCREPRPEPNLRDSKLVGGREVRAGGALVGAVPDARQTAHGGGVTVHVNLLEELPRGLYAA